MEDPDADLEHDTTTGRACSDEIDQKRRVAYVPEGGGWGVRDAVLIY